MPARAKNETVNNDGWEDVEEESQVVLDVIGDVFVGRFNGWTATEGKNIPQAHFVNSDGEFFINCGADLKQKLREASKDREYRIELIEERDTGQASPMRIHRVQSRRVRA